VQENIVKKINKLFISVRSKFIRQKDDGGYSHSDGFKTKLVLTDAMIEGHLSGTETIGIFCAERSTKFVLFDVDCGGCDENYRREVVLMIKDSLTNFGIAQDYIHTVFSGSKGYHLIIFLDEPTLLTNVTKLYEAVLNDTGLSSTIVELRPSPKVGVKVCMGIHRKTGNRCWFVDKAFKPIESFEHILGIEPMERVEFQQIVNLIKDVELVRDTSLVVYTDTSTSIPMLTVEKAMLLEQVGLTQSSTRNYSSVQLAILYNTLGLTEEDALIRLNNWIDWQNQDYYTTPLKACYYQNEKVINWVYRNKARFSTKQAKVVRIYQAEAKLISSVNDKYARHILFAMVCHAKRYEKESGETFFMSYSQIAFHTSVKDYGNTKKAIETLSKLGYIIIVKGSVYNSKNKKYDTNVYNLNIDVTNSKLAYKIDQYDIPYMSNTDKLNDLKIL
jgi:hypothetical protein